MASGTVTVTVSVKDTDVFKHAIEMLNALRDDKQTPEWIKGRIQYFLSEELKE